jgi:dUTP pyrophosphatase
MKLRYRAIGGIAPQRIYRSDAGFDLSTLKSKIIWPFCTVDLDTGFDIKVPSATWGCIKARSSTWKRRKLMVSEGVIDTGYTGKLSVLVFNPWPWPKFIKKGDRLAQLVLIPMCYPTITFVDEMPITDRGESAFGSSGD